MLSNICLILSVFASLDAHDTPRLPLGLVGKLLEDFVDVHRRRNPSSSRLFADSFAFAALCSAVRVRVQVFVNLQGYDLSLTHDTSWCADDQTTYPVMRILFKNDNHFTRLESLSDVAAVQAAISSAGRSLDYRKVTNDIQEAFNRDPREADEDAEFAKRMQDQEDAASAAALQAAGATSPLLIPTT